MSSFPVWEIHPVDARLTVVREVAPRMPARSQEILWVKLLATIPHFGVRAGMRAALSPKTREKAVADQDDIGWPFGMLREQSFLGLNAVNQRRPTKQHEEERDGIPFL